MNNDNKKQKTEDRRQKTEDRRQKTEDRNITTVSLSTSETASRYGSANAEFIKGYTGVDQETGQVFSKSLKGIANSKINPSYAEQNLKQQAGYAAEVATTSLDNAEAFINKSPLKTSRSDDLPQFGKNHNVVDRVKVLNGEIIEGTQSQMKFVGNRDTLFNDITKSDGKFARYRGIKLELPSEQYEGAAEFCKAKASELRSNALRAEQAGKPEVAQKLREQANNYDELAQNVADSGLTTERAIAYRRNPKLETARDIARTSHRAGIEGAKIGGVVGSSISILTNAFAVAQEKKQLEEATQGIITDTVKATALGYGTAFAGSAIKGAMQQSSKQYVRVLAGTNAPALAVNVVLSLGSSIKRYINGDIDKTQLLEEVGEKGAGMLSASMMAALGQLAIPIPFVGAAIGSMIGYTLSSMFYQSALEAGREAKIAKANLIHVLAIEAESRAEIEKQRNILTDFMAKEMPELLCETEQLFAAINHAQDVDTIAASINSYAELMGAQLQFKNQIEFDNFMLNSDKPLHL
jgi:hypothetical protein